MNPIVSHKIQMNYFIFLALNEQLLMQDGLV